MKVFSRSEHLGKPGVDWPVDLKVANNASVISRLDIGAVMGEVSQSSLDCTVHS